MGSDRTGNHVVIDVDVEVIVVVERAHVRPEHGIAVERDRDVEVQLIAVVDNLIIERDEVEWQRGKGLLRGHTQRKLRIARSGYERGVVPYGVESPAHRVEIATAGGGQDTVHGLLAIVGQLADLDKERRVIGPLPGEEKMAVLVPYLVHAMQRRGVGVEQVIKVIEVELHEAVIVVDRAVTNEDGLAQEGVQRLLIRAPIHLHEVEQVVLAHVIADGILELRVRHGGIGVAGLAQVIQIVLFRVKDDALLGDSRHVSSPPSCEKGGREEPAPPGHRLI